MRGVGECRTASQLGGGLELRALAEEAAEAPALGRPPVNPQVQTPIPVGEPQRCRVEEVFGNDRYWCKKLFWGYVVSVLSVNLRGQIDVALKVVDRKAQAERFGHREGARHRVADDLEIGRLVVCELASMHTRVRPMAAVETVGCPVELVVGEQVTIESEGPAAFGVDKRQEGQPREVLIRGAGA
jgi:hypothetical protein